MDFAALVGKLLQFVATSLDLLIFICIPFCLYYFVLSNKIFYPHFKSRFSLVLNLMSEKTKNQLFNVGIIDNLPLFSCHVMKQLGVKICLCWLKPSRM